MRAQVAALMLVGVCGVSVNLPAHSSQAEGARKTYRGLEVSVVSVERAGNASLRDCPPGENTVVGVAKPGEEFAVINVAFKVLPAFQPTPFKRPTLTDQSGTSYNTAVSFVDVGKVPEFTCAFPFRVPEGTKLKAFQLEQISLDLANVPAK